MTDIQIRYPEIEVQLTGTNDNAFAVLGHVNRQLRGAGVPYAERQRYVAEATSGNFDQLLATTMRWVTVL